MKGFLFGVSLVTLSLVVLGLSITVYKTNSERNGDLVRLSVFDRLDDEFKATQNGYKIILSNFIDIIVQGNNITFAETLQDTSASDFFTFADNFKTFVEKNSSFSTSIDLSGITNDLPLWVKPVNVLYNHPKNFGKDEIDVTNTGQVIGYNITILLNRTGATPVEWVSGPENNTAGLIVSIVTGGLTGNDFMFSGNLSRTKHSTLKIKIPGDDMFIDIGDKDVLGMLSITNKNKNTVAFVNTTLWVNATNLYVTFPDQSINITASEYSISKLSTVRVA